MTDYVFYLIAGFVFAGLDVGEFYAPDDPTVALKVAREFFRYRGGPVARIQRAGIAGWLHEEGNGHVR